MQNAWNNKLQMSVYAFLNFRIFLNVETTNKFYLPNQILGEQKNTLNNLIELFSYFNFVFSTKLLGT